MVCAALCVVLAASGSFTEPLLAQAEAEPVDALDWGEATDGVNLRNQPNTVNSRRIGMIAPGTPVRIEEREGEWLRITADEARGWVHGSMVVDLPEARRPWAAGQSAVALARINLRRGPGFEHPRRRVLSLGESVRVEERRGDWLHIRVGDREEGWLHRAYLSLEASEPAAWEPQTRVVGAGPRPEVSRSGDRERVLAVVLNHRPAGSAVILQKAASGRLMARAEDVLAWRLVSDGLPSHEEGGQQWYYLDEIAGLGVLLDEGRQELYLEAELRAFESYRRDLLPLRYLEPTAAQPGAYLNYEVVGHSGGAAPDRLNGQLELNVFGPVGSGVHQMVVRRDGAGTAMTRLQTAWIVDLPTKKSTLTLGDGVTDGASWWRSAHFGGIQWATNNRTRPGYLSNPLLGFAGEAVTPSTFELYLDNALRLRERIPEGPFELRNLPVVNGRGDYQLVLRDALGREIVQEQTFITSTQMLRRGLREYSYSLGVLRRDLGTASDSYGRSVLLASERRGLTDRFTLDLHGELLADHQTLGVGGALGLPRLGILEFATAASSSAEGTDGLLALGFNRYQKNFTVGIDLERAGRDFARLGSGTDTTTRKSMVQARLAGRSNRFGSYSLAYAQRRRWDDTATEIASLSLNRSLPRGVFLTASLVQSLGALDNTEVSLTFSRPLGRHESLSTTARGGGLAGESLAVTFQETPPIGPGFGYSISAEAGDRERIDGSLQLVSEVGTLALNGAQLEDGNALRASWKGGLAAVGGDLFATRTVEDSFAVVRVGGQPGVRVYHENQLIGRTDGKGRLLVERMLPYQRNALRIEEQDLEIDVTVQRLEVEASTYARSGIVVDFPVQRTRDALVIVHGPDGTVLPAGSTLVTADAARSFPVAGDGQAFVTAIGEGMVLLSEFEGALCRISVEWPLGKGVQPTLGPLTCEVVE